MGGSKAEVERTRETLSHFIELSGLSRREVEKRLLDEGCGTDLGRLLSGRLDLKLRHILDICRVIGLYPQELFRIVFKDTDQRSPLIQQLDALTGPNRLPGTARTPAPRSPATDLEEMNRRLTEILRRLDALAPASPNPARPR
jgi:hypothetical protein